MIIQAEYQGPPWGSPRPCSSCNVGVQGLSGPAEVITDVAMRLSSPVRGLIRPLDKHPFIALTLMGLTGFAAYKLVKARR